MEKKKFFIATLLVAAAVSVAVVSCKKETPNALHNNNSPSVKTFAVPQVDDMNAYLKDFKKKMQTATRDGNETLSLEEAAWHLSSVANYDFANANVEFDDIRFDTLYSTVNVIGDIILLNDLATAYENISTNIDEFYHSLSLDNKHFRFIDAKVSDCGDVVISIITTYINAEKLHYFEDDSYCDEYFSNTIQYTANDVAVSTLTSLFNLFLEKNTDPNEGREYYVITRTTPFYCTQWHEDLDEYCPNNDHSRLYCSGREYDWPIPMSHMCYYADSYVGLGKENTDLFAPAVISGYVYFQTAVRFTDEITEQQLGNHVLVVNYGLVVMGDINGY